MFQQVLQVTASVVFFFCVKFFYELDYTQFILNEASMPWRGDQYTHDESLLVFFTSFFSYVVFLLIMNKTSEWLAQKHDWDQYTLTIIKLVAYMAIGLTIWFEYDGNIWLVVNFVLLLLALIITKICSLHDA